MAAEGILKKNALLMLESDGDGFCALPQRRDRLKTVFERGLSTARFDAVR